jgi:hypothetical protein
MREDRSALLEEGVHSLALSLGRERGLEKPLLVQDAFVGYRNVTPRRPRL